MFHLKQLSKFVRSALALMLLTASTFSVKAADFYWVGGSGDWSDIANHWATSSGGSTFHTLVPTPLDDVHFDANSFGAGSDVVTITFEAFCKSFTAANMPTGVTFQFNSGINIEEDFSVDGDVNINHHTGNFVVKGGDVTLDNSVYFYKVNGHFYVTGGDVFLGDDVYFDKRGWVQQTYIYDGTFYFTGSNASFYHYDGYLRCYDGGMDVTGTNYFYTSSHDGYFYGDLEVASGATAVMSRTTRMYNGGVSFDAAATITQNASLYFYTTSTATYNIKTGGHEMRRIEISGTNYGATYNLQDDLKCENEGLYMYANIFKSNGHAIDVGRFYSWTGGVVKIDLTGTSLVRVKREWRIYPSTNTTLIMDNADIEYYQNTHQYLYGGNKTYNDVTFNITNNGGYQIYINYNNTFDNVTVNSYGSAYLRWYGNNTMDNFTWNYLNDVNSQQTLGIYGSNTVTGTLDFNLSGNRPIIQMNGSNNIGTLDFGKPKQILLGAGSTQTVGTINPIIGTCDETILINSTSLNSTARLSQATGTISADWTLMQDNTAQGGATFNATNTVDLGNVSGWNITALTAVTYYWIGGSGNWNDPNHWSLTSGGATNGCAIPSRIDDVVFDANSFSASGQFCNMNVVGDCHTMTWNGVTTGAGFNGGQALNIYGNLTCDANMNWSKSGDLYFQATDAGNTITTNGIKLYQLRFTGQGVSTGEWILQDDLACHNVLFFERGSFVSNGHDLDVYSFYNWTGSVADIDFTGTSTIELDYEWRIYPSTNVTLTMDAATIHHYSNNHMYFYGGNNTYHDLHIEFINTGNYYIRHQYSNTFRDVKITAPGSFYSDWYDNSTFRNFEAYQNGTGNTQQHFTMHGINTFNDFTFKGNGATKPYWRVYNNNTINGTLTLENLIRWEINAGRTQTINQGTVTGDCNQWMELRSRSYNSQTNISVPTGNALTIDYLYLQDINSSGAGDIDAYNSADVNNNTGNIIWNTTTPTNFYWVGGAGNWSDLNNWSYASGGTPGVTCLPSLLDNVFFDVNSFSSSGQNVNINTLAYCNNMIWDNVNFPTISGTSMYIYGSMILDKNLTWNNGSWIYMMATDQGNTIKTEGVQLYYLDFRSSYSGTGEWTLQDDLELRYDMWLRSGTLRSGGNEITLRSFFAWENRDMTLDLSGSTDFNLSHWWQWYPNNSNTLIMDDCDLNWDYEGHEFLSYFGSNETFNNITYNHTPANNHRIYHHYTNGSTFGNITMNLGGYQRVEFHQNIVADDITINYTNPTNNIPTVYFYSTANLNTLSITSTGNAGPYVYLNQSNTFNDLIAAGVGTRLYLGANRVQTVNGILSIGSGGFPVHMRSTTDGSTATLYKPSGEVCLDFVLLKDVTATSVNGSDVTDDTDFFAGAQSANLGNNSSNWSFTSCGAYYWVGGTGDWSDLSHWATSSGGSVNHTTLPSAADDVYFDANSFNGANQVVTIDVANPTAKNMTWQSALFTPTLAGASGMDNLYIYGSLKLIPSMNQNFTGDWNFMSNVSGNTVNSASQPMTDVTFVGGNDGEGGWDLDNVLDVSGTIDFRNGSLDLDDWDVSTKNFNATTPNTRTLNLTSSEISINDGQWNPSDATNLTFDEGTSKIVVQGTSASNFFGNGLTYNDVTFTSSTTLASSITGSNTFNTLRFEAGVTATIDAGTTQTATQIEAEGECTRNVVWKSSSQGNDYNFSQASGTTDVEFTAMSDNNGSGTATYDAALSTNNGGNSNWNFSSAAILTVSQETGLVDCITNNDGFAKVTPLTGTAPYSYVWSTLETTQQINGLLPGTYTVTVTDANGCTAIEDLDVINQPSALDPVDFSISDADVCIGTSQTFTADDISSTALDFDGSGDHVLVANNSAFETSSGTIEMWLNSAGSSDNEAFVGMRTSTSNTRYSFHVNENANTIGIFNGAGFYTLSQNINVGQWYHVAVVFNATTTTVYVDGASIGTLPGINTSKTGMALSIGSPNDGSYTHEWFTGKLDDVRIWDDQRTPSEILALKDIPLYGSESNLVAYYNFEDGTGSSTASDKTANGFNGTLTNMDANTDWVSPGGLNPTVTYEWDFDDFTSASTQTANHTYGSGGTYEVELKVRDAAGCPVTTTKTVQVGDIQQSVTKINVLCKGEDNGSIDIVGSGGITPYEYSIDGGTTYVSTSSFNSLVPGTYQVRTKDAIGCETSIQNFTVTEPASNVAFTVNNIIDTECPGELTGGFTINPTGGTPSYVYSINNGINYVPFNLITGQPAGTYTVKVRDANGCETGSQSVTIDQVDDEDPEVSGCPADFTVFTSAGQCTASATWTAPTATDNCGTPSINQTQGPISGSTFALGVHTIEYEISDADGNTVSCSFDITVKDQGNPTAQCMNTTVYLDANGEASITAADIDDNSFDDCSTVTLSASQTDFTTAHLGNNNVVLTVMDAGGNTSTCTAVVTVVDNTDPTASCKNITVQLDANGDYTLDPASINDGSTDNSGVFTLSASQVAFDCTDIGANNVTLTVTDGSNNTATCIATVTVEDKVDPVAICQDITVQLDANGDATITASQIDNGSNDACGIASLVASQTDFNCTHVGANTVTLTVTDNNGNTSTCDATVTVQDNIDPVALCKNITVSLDVNGDATITAAQIDNGSNDACGVTLSASPTSFDCSNTGANNVTLSVTDGNGNVSTCVAVVTVEDNTDPTASCNNLTIDLQNRNAYTLTQSDIDYIANGSDDNCSFTYAITSGQTTFDCDDRGQTHTVTLTVTDASGNTSTCNADITVTNQNSTCNDPPVAVCKNITVYTGANCDATIVATDVDGGSTDPDGDPLTYTLDTYGPFTVGTHTVTLTVGDGEYTDDCTATVTVEDNTNPNAVCKNITIQLDANGEASIVGADINDGSSDACGIASLVASQTDFDCTHIGTNTVTLTVTDNNNNVSTCTSTVTVEDNVNPEALCKSFTVGLDYLGRADVTALDINDGSNDACGISTLAISQSQFDCSHLGSNEVVLTVTDNHSNVSTCTTTVTVIDTTAPQLVCNPWSVGLDVNGEFSLDTGMLDTFTGYDLRSSVAAYKKFRKQLAIDRRNAAYIRVGRATNEIYEDLGFAYDACSITGYSASQMDFDCSDVGDNPIVITVTDASGNTTTCSDTITIYDSVPPVAVCKDITIELDANGEASIVASDIDGGSNDACGIASISASKTDFICSELGDNTVTLTVTDNNGNVSTCTATVTVEDNIAPEFLSCQCDVIRPNDAGNCDAYVKMQCPVITDDNCSVVSVVNDYTGTADASGTYPVGVTTVTWTVTDQSGNSSDYVQVVMILDIEKPTATCVAPITQTADAGECGADVIVAAPNAADNCGIMWIENNRTGVDNANDWYPVGTTTVRWLIQDVNGNFTYCTSTVTVEDDEAPAVTCQADVVASNDNGSCSAALTIASPSTTDNCSVATVTNDYNNTSDASDTYPVGTTTVTWTVTDIHGNSSTCTQLVTVEDTEAPAAICQNTTVQLDALGNGSISVSDINNGSSDNCGVASMSLDNSSFTCSDVGANTVVLTVTDIHGNSSTCTATVTVEDNVAPTAICQNITVQLDASGMASIVAANIDNGSNDACGIASLTINTSSFDCSDVGANSVTLTVTDNNGNSSTCTATVTVEDNIAPNAICQNLTLQLDANGQASTTAGAVNDGSNDACGIANMSLNQTTFDCSNIGNNVVILTVEDNNGNQSTCQATITIEDNVAPSITCPANVSVNNDNNDCGAQVTVGAPVTSDNCAVATVVNDYNNSSDASDHYPVGTTNITWTVTDVNGNESTCGMSVTVTDNQAPNAICQNLTVQLDANGDASISVSDIDNGSFDNCGVDSKTINVNSFDCSGVGANTVTLTVTDIYGNSSTCTSTVTVEDNVNPIAICKNATIQLDGNGEGSITTTDINNGSNDACGIANMSLNQTDFNCSHIGQNIVTLTVVDNNGNSSTCQASVTVRDEVAPTAICQNITVQLNASGTASITANDVNDGSNDACGIASLSIDNNSFSCTDVGANTVVLTVTDNNGNSSTCTSTVTVEDNVAPTASCKNITVQLDANGDATINASDVNDGSSDACGVASLSIDNASFDCSDVGANTVTLTVTDNNGNSSTCTSTVTVEDNVAPTAVCKNITIQLNAMGDAAIVASDINNGSSDACGIANLAASKTSFSCSDVGANTVTLTVTDNNGNTNTCDATVTVEDNVAPNAICQNITVQLDATGAASITASDINNGSNDACGIASMTINNSNFDCSNVGVNTVTLTVTDNNGNSSTCTSTVTVEDNVAPTAICQNITVQLDANGDASIVANDINNGSSDACGIASTTIDNASFDCSDVGANTVTLTVTDNNGNASTCTSTVTVEDNVKPQAICKDIIIQLDANGNASIVANDINNGSNDACGIASLAASQTSFDCSHLGVNNVSLTITDNNGNSSSCMAKVTVQDNIAPIISGMPSNITVNAQRNDCDPIVTWTPPTASDNCSVVSFTASNQSGEEFVVGTHTVNYLATDQSNNSTSGSFTITVVPDPLVITSLSATTYNGGYNISCNGNSDGSATVIVEGGCLPYAYDWSSGHTSNSATGLQAGTYTVTITDANGTVITQDITLTEPDALSASVATTDIVCHIEADQTCKLYPYSSGQHAVWLPNLPGSPSSKYIFDTHGSFEVYADGSAHLTGTVVNASNSNYSWEIDVWFTGKMNWTDWSALGRGWKGNSSVVGNKYKDWDYYVMDEARIATLTGTGNYAGKTLYLSHKPSTLYYGFQVGKAANDKDYSNGMSGWFTYNGDYTGQGDFNFDSNCKSSQNCDCEGRMREFTVSYSGSNNAKVYARTGSNYSHWNCKNLSTFTNVQDGDNLTISGNWKSGRLGPKTWLTIGGVRYEIHTSCSEDILGKTFGPFTVTSYTDGDGNYCSVNTGMGCDGEAEIAISGGTAPFTVEWTNGSTGTDVTGICMGTYGVNVTDANGCTYYTTFTINNPDELELTLSETDPACHDGSDGSIDATVSGGVAPYTYTWSNNESTQDINNLPAGTYELIVTDAGGCSVIAEVTLDNPKQSIYLSGTVYDASCSGKADGAINLKVYCSKKVSSIVWSHGPTTEDVSGLAAGTYSVTVTDKYGCSETMTFTVEEPDPVSVSATSPTYSNGYNISSYGALDGEIDLTVSGGTPGYTYDWAGSATTTATMTRQVNHKYADAEENKKGNMSTRSSDLELVEDGSNGKQQVGLLFSHINIPQGATITEAYIQFTTEGTSRNSSSVNLNIYGHDVDNSWMFTSKKRNISSRTTTSSNVNWQPAKWTTMNESGAKQTTPDVSGIVQEIVDRNGWKDGYCMTFLIKGSGLREAWSYDGSSSKAPMLIIKYEEQVTGSNPDDLGAGYYTVKVTDRNGCATSTSITLTQPTQGSRAVKDERVLRDNAFGESVGQAALEISPNPVSQTATVTFNLEEQTQAVVRVTDMTGKTLETVYTGMVPAAQDVQVQTSLEGLRSGIYQISITTTNGQHIVKRFVIAR